MAALQGQGQVFTQRWFDKLAAKQFVGAYADLFDPAERPKLEAGAWSRLVLLHALLPPAGPGTPHVNPGLAIWLGALAPDWAVPDATTRLSKVLVVESRRIRADDENLRKTAVELGRSLLSPNRPKVPLRGTMVEGMSAQRPAAVIGSTVQFTYDAQVGFPPYRLDTMVTVESTTNYDDPVKPPGWKIIRVEPFSLVDTSRMEEAMGGGPGGPPR
jgi:hypothetical protein